MANRKMPKHMKKLQIRGGRPKGSRPITALIGEMLEKEIRINNPLTKKKELMSMAEIIAMRIVTKAAAGDIRAIKELLDRREGKSVQVNEISGIGGAPIAMQHSTIDLDNMSVEDLKSLGTLVAKHAIKSDEDTTSIT